MPWCDTCDVYLAPNTVKVDGACPACDDQVDAGDAGAAAVGAKVPWHFWIVVAALVAYLGWRLVEAVLYVLDRF